LISRSASVSSSSKNATRFPICWYPCGRYFRQCVSASSAILPILTTSTFHGAPGPASQARADLLQPFRGQCDTGLRIDFASEPVELGEHILGRQPVEPGELVGLGDDLFRVIAVEQLLHRTEGHRFRALGVGQLVPDLLDGVRGVDVGLALQRADLPLAPRGVPNLDQVTQVGDAIGGAHPRVAQVAFDEFVLLCAVRRVGEGQLCRVDHGRDGVVPGLVGRGHGGEHRPPVRWETGGPVGVLRGAPAGLRQPRLPLNVDTLGGLLVQRGLDERHR